LAVAKAGSNAIEVSPPSPLMSTTEWMSRNALGSRRPERAARENADVALALTMKSRPSPGIGDEDRALGRGDELEQRVGLGARLRGEREHE
jgi:hypothetical protein